MCFACGCGPSVAVVGISPLRGAVKDKLAGEKYESYIEQLGLPLLKADGREDPPCVDDALPLLEPLGRLPDEERHKAELQLPQQARLCVPAPVLLVALGLPPPFTVVPRLIVQGAGSAVMRSVTDLILPQFVNLLEKDYTRWANGTRDASVSVGTLMDVESVTVDAGGGDDGASS